MQFTYIGSQSKKDVRVASSIANGAFVTANSASSFANGAFGAANSASLYANAAFAAANSVSSYANSAFITAENALPKTGGNVTGVVTFSQITQFTSNATSTSNSTGAVIVAGGVGGFE